MTPASGRADEDAGGAGETLDVLRSIDSKLSVLLAMAIDGHLRSNPELGSSRHPSLDSLLSEAGLSSRQIGLLLGKTRQAVEQKISRERPRESRPGGRAGRGGS
jgi:hypothetical protein